MLLFFVHYEKFSRNFTVTKIACKFATINANQTILVSLERRESYLSPETKNVQIEWKDGKLHWNWICICDFLFEKGDALYCHTYVGFVVLNITL